MRQTTFTLDIDTNPLPVEERPTYQGHELARYSDESYQAAFALVRDESNWKYPIDAQVTVPSGVDLDAAVTLITDAIVHIAGCLPDVVHAGRTVRFQAVGYYAAVGA